MKILVCGGRNFSNYHVIYSVLDGYLGSVDLVVNGNATGADEWATSWAKENGVPVSVFCPDWKRLGKAAGPIRNQRMIDEGKPDLVIAFPGGRGTADMVNRAKIAGIPVREIGS
jgi:hypothetical protein